MIKQLQKFIDFTVPKALPLRAFSKDTKAYTWEDWERDMKKNHPYKLFFLKTVPDELSHIKSKVDHFFYYLRSVTYHKQHFLDLRQPKGFCYDYRWGYRDMDQKIIFANFNLLCEFVENEYKGEEDIQSHINNLKTDYQYNHTAEINFLEKVLELYNWYKRELPVKLKEAYDDIGNEKISCLNAFDKEIELDKEINEKLKEIIDYRLYFWT